MVRAQSPAHAEREEARVLSANISGKTMQRSCVVVLQSAGPSVVVSSNKDKGEEAVRVQVVVTRGSFRCGRQPSGYRARCGRPCL